MNTEQYNSRPKVYFTKLYFLLFVIAFIIWFAIGYELSEILFRFTGKPSELLMRIISGLCGICAVLTYIVVVRGFILRYGKKHFGKQFHNHILSHSILKNTMDAIDKISRGDFNVFIDAEENNPFKEVAESVNKMARELSSMEKLRQDFISNVSHEIQSPLTSINGFAALLKTASLTENEKLHYIDIIETESKRLSNLSSNLLKLSALESTVTPIAQRRYHLDKQIENAVLMLEPQWAAKNLNPDISLSKTFFYGDEELLNQVWINLLHNAIKFTRQGGTFGVLLASYKNEIQCRIFDNGIGIAKEDQIHIFERFYKADKSRDRSLGGNGLGLSLVKKIVELHNGTIELQSEIGKGTSFTIVLPCLQ
ncbi:MAG: HAMP domain-containing histidine kinase [Elusimicrobiota bacterium]|jgi:signal transduction histidine kinase|nr:HAMP domain-containing histidine kinase [Elusimicrobiota bacterium]